ncbi:MAG: c-type cytochrome [Pedosphaera sp.]|nr:c-type cytochrome [Pedosphaera sp.]
MTTLPPFAHHARPGIHAALLAGLVFSAISIIRIAADEDPFAAGVRPTDPLSPTEQQKKFKLPPGFEIQLVATEPDINKPFNMAFDARGRLWVTTSIEYPWPAPTNRVGRDRLMIFEDFAPDGRARKVTEFASGLNIPIGIYPFYSARTTPKASPTSPDLTWKAIVWSIPNIWLMEDTDGDGKADKRVVLYGPFDHTRDTHGNQASFRRGFDGWLYATHGFNNDSHVTARDGSHVDLNSGNTYRMRLDGSRIEQHTHGQVNPYGLAWDPSGNLYSSDCHSAPIYQLLTGGWYPSFGKPNDGLGFAPVLMEHAHGSTAIDGIVYYTDNLWPDEYRDNIFIGNVMTSRLNRDKLVFHGSTPEAIEQEDFLKTDDPWFRPVDNQLGPDGALYIADFYNRIIGHYEVPLTHPGRDRERGRIWRVVYKGTDGKAKLHDRKLDLTTASAGQLVKELADSNLTWRMLVANQLVDRFGQSAAGALKAGLRSVRGTASRPDAINTAFKHLQILWTLERLGAAGEGDLRSAGTSGNTLLRVHAMRLIAERGLLAASMPGSNAARSRLKPVLQKMAIPALKDSDALVQRCAAEALGNAPDFDFLAPLLSLRQRVPKEDTHLLYVLRKSIRDHLNDGDIFGRVANAKWSAPELNALADVAVAVKSEGAGSFLNKHLATLDLDRPTLTAALQHIARYAPASELDSLGVFVKTKFATDVDFQLALFNGVSSGAEQRGSKLSNALRDWGGELCSRVLAQNTDTGWYNSPFENAPTANPWAFQERRCADGQKAQLLSTLPGGEELTGVLRSREFTLPAKLTFYLAGHDGFPERPAKKKNVVRLWLASRTSDGNGEKSAPIVEAYAPRNDTAQKITWDLSAHVGKRGFVEVTDADTDESYAWIALGRFDPPIVAMPSIAPTEIVKRQQTACDLAARLQLASFAPNLSSLANDREADSEARASAARALLAVASSATVPMLSSTLSDASEPVLFRTRLGELLAEQKSPQALTAVVAAMKSAPYRTQLRWAIPLATSGAGADALLNAVASGAASPRLLQSIGVKNRIAAVKPEGWQDRITALTKNLPPADETRDKLIAEKRQAFQTSGSKATDGHRVFQQICAVCHRIGTEGALVGPQLDGIGNRGLDRILEDVLDPNRNVDVAFRAQTISLKDGDTVTGLARREEGELLVLADSTGKEISIPKKSIKSRRDSDLSLMPENLGEALSAEDFNHLVAYLIGQKGSTK